MTAAQNFVLLVVAIGALYAIKELGILSKLREMGSRRMAIQVGGFSVGLVWGPAVISAITGAFSGLAAISTTNIAGLTNISPRTMLVVGIAFLGLMVLSRVRADEVEDSD